MLRSLNRYLIDFINGRIDEITNDVAERNKTSRHFTLKIIKVLNTIKSVLPSKYRKLLEELSDLQSKRELIIYEAVYKRAFMDGIKLSNLLCEKSPPSPSILFKIKKRK